MRDIRRDDTRFTGEREEHDVNYKKLTDTKIPMGDMRNRHGNSIYDILFFTSHFSGCGCLHRPGFIETPSSNTTKIAWYELCTGIEYSERLHDYTTKNK